MSTHPTDVPNPSGYPTGGDPSTVGGYPDTATWDWDEMAHRYAHLGESFLEVMRGRAGSVRRRAGPAARMTADTLPAAPFTPAEWQTRARPAWSVVHVPTDECHDRGPVALGAALLGLLLLALSVFAALSNQHQVNQRQNVINQQQVRIDQEQACINQQILAYIRSGPRAGQRCAG